MVIPLLAFGIPKEEAFKMIDEEMARYLKEHKKIN